MLKQREVVLRERCCYQRQAPLGVQIPNRDAHVGLHAAVAINSDAPRQSGLFERPIPLVKEQQVRIGVVGDEQIQLAVLIEVLKHRCKAVSGGG